MGSKVAMATAETAAAHSEHSKGSQQTPTHAKPSFVDVPTSAGVITVRPLSWEGYKAIKSLLLGRIADELAMLVQDFMSTLDGEFSRAETIRFLPELVGAASKLVDEVTPDFVASSIDVPLPDSLSAIDWLNLRNACAEVTDLGEVMRAEKKSLTSVLGTSDAGRAIAELIEGILSDIGLSDMSTSSTASTDGLETTSGEPTL